MKTNEYPTKRYCEYCKKWIEFKNYQSLGSHKRTCPQKILYTFICPKCKTSFVLEMTEYAYKNKREPFRIHCSRSCANSHIQTEEQNLKRKIKEIKVRICPICKIQHKEVKFKKILCSENCLIEYRKEIIKKKKIMIQQKMEERRKLLPEMKKYYEDVKFKFNIWEYPEEFDLSLIEKYGWYSASNRGNNIEGISRDHMISINFGFNNKIPSEMISHPANCMLVKHRKNMSKNVCCSITLEDLKEKIDNWNKKYGTRSSDRSE